MSYADDFTMRKNLREPFPPEQVGRLPATAKRPALDYVGHAAVTNRLNNAAPDWTYRITPVEVRGRTVTEDGKPRFITDPEGFPHVVAVFGEMTVGGVTRQEVGEVDAFTTYGRELKEAISDFIRRAAMRFGVGLDLWTKEDLETPTDPEPVAGSPAADGNGEDGGAGSPTSDRAEALGEAQTAPTSEPVAPVEEQAVAPATARIQGEGATGSTGEVGSHDSSLLPSSTSPGTSEAPSGRASDGEATPAAGTSDDTAPQRATTGASVSAGEPPHDPGKDSLIREVLRLQHEARWSDAKLEEFAAGGLHHVSIEQLRYVRGELREAIAATRVTPEQKAKLKALATPRDQIKAAQVYVSADIRRVADLTSDEADRLIAALEKVRAEQGAA